MLSTRTLGRTGLRVSPFCLGTMTFGTDWGWGSDRPTTERIFDRYLEFGGNFVDTADLYVGGVSESWLGEMMAARKNRDRMVVATKFSYSADPSDPNGGGNGRKHAMAALDQSLRRLGTDYVDLFMLHTWDTITPAEEVLRTFDDLVRTTKVRYVGLSDVPAWYAARIQTLAQKEGLHPFCTLQMEYSLLERNIEHEFIPMARELGMGIMAWSPLASGLLSGKHKPSQLGGGRAEVMKDSTNPAFAKLSNPKVWSVVAELERVAEDLGKPMAQVALRWLADRPGVDSVIVGATRLEQLESNLEAAQLELPKEAAAQLDAASAPDRPFPYSFFEGEIQNMIHGEAPPRPRGPA